MQAQSAQAAEIWLWDTATWAPAGRLPAHGLTVTQLAFSADGRYLASASRDRGFAVFAEQPPGSAGEIDGSASDRMCTGDVLAGSLPPLLWGGNATADVSICF